MTNTNDEDVDLGLALGARNYSLHTRLNSRVGAGGNADSRVDIALAASDPLSELVWTPHNGLSLKCADSSLADNKPFLLGSVGPSLKELSASPGIRSKESGDDKVAYEEKLAILKKMLNVDEKFDGKGNLFRSSRGSCSFELDAHQRHCDVGSNGEMEEKASSIDAIQKEENRKDDIDEDLCSSQDVQNADITESSKRNADVQIADIAESSKRNAEDSVADGISESKVDMAMNRQFSSKLIGRTQCDQNSRVEINASRSDIIGSAVPIRFEPQAEKLSEALSCSLPDSLFLQERDDEVTSASGDTKKNKTRMLISIPAPALMELECSAENDLAHVAAKEAPRENSRPVHISPTSSRIHLYRENRKEKALPNCNFCGRSSNDEDNSHESMESCNSVGLFSKGIKRQCYDQAQLVESKRMKMQHGSTSEVRPDSSFMNWISNMVKGLPNSNKDESSSLALALAQSNKPHDCESPILGFQTVFRSLYCQDSGVNDNYSIEKSKELMVADKKSFQNIPRSCDGNKDNSCKQIVLSNKEVCCNTSENIVGHPIKPWIFSANFACSPYASERSLVVNKASQIPGCNMAKSEISPSDSLSKQVNITTENTSPNIPLAMSEKSNPCADLWITRLYTRTDGLENCNQITKEADVFSISEKVSEARGDSAEDRVHSLEQEMQGFAAKGSNDLKSTHKLTPLQLPQKLRNSEAMASVFAKRLYALRHIIQPSEKRKASTCTLICFFCGRSGHDLRKCPELTETEVEDLLEKISTFDSVEESPCLCIKCFQFDHWAISCPSASSHRHRRSETCHLQICADNDKSSSYLGGKEKDNKQIADCQVACSSKKPGFGYCPSYLTWNVKDSSSKRLSTSNELQNRTTSDSEKHLKDKQKFLWCKIVNAHNTVAVEEMFRAIRKLHLSRSDILRWMDSNVSLSHLNGFFLRLRVGKLEAGLGWTGYYVARVTGCAIENTDCKSKKSILVDVGGIKSSVGSQYVSNHDFLEDEINAWWSRTVKTGGKIPLLDELNSKFEDRKSLGF